MAVLTTKKRKTLSAMYLECLDQCKRCGGNLYTLFEYRDGACYAAWGCRCGWTQRGKDIIVYSTIATNRCPGCHSAVGIIVVQTIVNRIVAKCQIWRCGACGWQNKS